MALHLHRAPRTDLLADALGELLSTPLADPFAQEVVVVPAKGVERWLTQRLSHRLGGSPGRDDGVCAGVRFVRPQSLVGLLLGRDDDDPWDPERLVWPLLATIDESLGEPWCAVLARHLGHRAGAEADPLRRTRRYSVALRLAHLLASYAVQRPQLVADWREGRDTDGAGGALDADLLWQAELWRRVLTRVADDPPDVRHRLTVQRLRDGEVPALPARLSLFGHTRLPVTEVELLGALAATRDVHLHLPQPSPALWDALGRAGLGGVVRRDDDRSAALVGHPLLASLGRDARELRRTLDPLEVADDTVRHLPAEGAAPATLLAWLQHDLRADSSPTAEERAARVVAADDRSLQVHACHGAARQVDVLREVLVGLLEDDPTLEPRDILVMCPDIETFAPLVSAGFGLATGATAATAAAHPAHRLRVRLADRALSSTNPLLSVAATLLELAGGRVTAPQVLDLASGDAVRRRFGLTDDDLARLARWVGEAGVRWGVDAAAREPFAMQGFPQHTWSAGLDRILLGVAMSGDEHRHLGRGLPLDDVGSGEIDLAGKLAELLDRLGGCLAGLGSATTAEQWVGGLRRGVRDLTDSGPDDAWQLPQLERELARVVAASGAGGAGEEVDLRLPDVRALLDSRLAGRPTRANFRTGTLTVCTMVPMRSVPHRVVCLVGLDDGVFPRSRVVDGDDVLGRGPLTGERDGRSEDRQLLLDAVLAAGEHVVVTYAGADEHTGATRPPAVPLGEVLDAADRTTSGPVRDHVLTRHPLQPHDWRNLRAAGSADTDDDQTDPDLPGPAQRPFSFDRSALAGARAAARPPHPVPPLLAAPLAEAPLDDVSLADLRAFLAHPVRTFLRRRLDVSTPLQPDTLADRMPVALDQLQSWQVGDRLLREVLLGHDPGAVMLAEQLRGSLPAGSLGEHALREVTTECQALWSRTAPLREGERRSLDVDVDLGGGRRLSGTVAPVHGGRVLSLGYSRLKARQRLETWVDLLAVTVSHPDQSWTGHAVGRYRAGPRRALSGPLDERALEWLRDLVALRDLGLREPLALPVATAAAWADAHHAQLTGQDVDPVTAARKAWTTDRFADHGIPGEDDDAHHRRVWGPSAPLETLLAAGLGDLAWRVWAPLLTGAERVGPL